MKTFFIETDRLVLERYRVLAKYKKQKIWQRRPGKRKLQPGGLKGFEISIPFNIN